MRLMRIIIIILIYVNKKFLSFIDLYLALYNKNRISKGTTYNRQLKTNKTMMHVISNVLNPEQLQQIREQLEQAAWQDGKLSAGHEALKAKNNLQLDEKQPIAQQLSEFILQLLSSNAQFMATALPLKVFPPRFNRYEGGGTYGNHIDSAVLSVANTPHRVRGDISATLFLSEPEEYDGGELVIQDSYGEHRVKLPAGHMVLYPSSSLHRVTPVERGCRLASFFWVQSMVREDHLRSILFDLDQAIQGISTESPSSQQIPKLLGVYHNLLRNWAET